jgi:tetratricopeptide (TPR) repeat protein
MEPTLSLSQFDAALRAVEQDTATPQEKAEMLMEIAMGMQARPKSIEQLQQAIALYERALQTCPAEAPLLRARINARMGTAVQALPDAGSDSLYRAMDCHEAALKVLSEKGRPEECAEVEMNLGLVLQSFPGGTRVVEALRHYHAALRTFTREQYPQEYAILHNNLAIAYLSIPLSDERAKMREALAVQSFEEVLKVITLVDHPSEYAMIQNNLGNALQYAASGHALENNLRALAAYDEALKVRTVRDTPLEYANTISNKANVLRNLPPDIEAPGLVPGQALSQARELYEEARRIFLSYRQDGSAGVVDEALGDLAQQVLAMQGGQRADIADMSH